MNHTTSPLALPAFVRQHVFDSDAAMASALAAAVADGLRAGLAGRGSASLAVSGGRSPIPFLEALSAEMLDWSRVVVTLVDERLTSVEAEDRLRQRGLAWQQRKTTLDAEAAAILLQAYLDTHRHEHGQARL